ncbi:MAG: hypothetical protein P4M10_00490 [Verrucomicrobiae bacterium]|nr:hypothetical protein [Verrucomicrobiae bacterium]
MQNAMQRVRVIKTVDLTDLSDSSTDDLSPKTEPVVPDSFAEWLAQPSGTITGGPDLAQGVFVGVMNQCQIHIAGHPPSHPV